MLQFLFSKFSDYYFLSQQASALFNGIQLLLSGFLPSSLVPVNTLIQIIADIDKHLVPFEFSARISETNPSSYYTNRDFLFVRSGENLFITVKFPLRIDDGDLLRVYQVTTFPVPFHNDSALFTRLSHPSKYLGISHDSYMFAETIVPTSVKTRFRGEVLIQRPSASCLFALFEDQLAGIKMLCSFQVLKSSDIHTDLFVINYPQILVRSPDVLKFDCPFTHFAPPPCSYCFLTVPCACSVSTRRSFLPARVNQCPPFEDIPDASPIGIPLT